MTSPRVPFKGSNDISPREVARSNSDHKYVLVAMMMVIKTKLRNFKSETEKTPGE